MRLLAIIILTLLTTQAGASERPSQCPVHRWCGCALAMKLFGEPRKDLWAAREWLKLGHPIRNPIPGAIAVYARGKGGHVGIVTAVTGPHKIVLWSGNDGGEIRERERSTGGIIGYRML